MNKTNIYSIIGRSLATAFGLFFIIAFIGDGITERPALRDVPVLMVIIFIFIVFSIIVSWYEMRLGAWLLLLFGITFGVDAYFRSGRNHWLAASLTSGPLIISSALIFIQAALNKKLRKTK